ncbi:hypothetical protein D8674_014739 [Pyrus ussuriensis x Pyrus communis]|uniref:Uncharacterized protein n=1 Tax=Pyrus ussuriensis x Pyrus communis TaxID=2448454 RepID=A0A5N5H0I3_9ROSA|nr:hypothetical protein D8674_040286 [Pyrus ussuriensis x Pyrus communis]KAB2618870.1 hypothetical protein D8674_014739 [Pyrus ussuriensis x Pyrus communis]
MMIWHVALWESAYVLSSCESQASEYSNRNCLQRLLVPAAASGLVGRQEPWQDYSGGQLHGLSWEEIERISIEGERGRAARDRLQTSSHLSFFRPRVVVLFFRLLILYSSKERTYIRLGCSIHRFFRGKNIMPNRQYCTQSCGDPLVDETKYCIDSLVCLKHEIPDM